VIKNNRYKANRLHFISFIILTFLVLFVLLKSLNIRSIIDTEIQNFQKNFSSFSSLRQLIDDGVNGSGAFDSNSMVKVLGKAPKIIYHSLTNDVENKLPKIELFIKFKHLEEIYMDRSRAILNGINANPQYVPCKISDGIKILKCKVRLKGDLLDHWDAASRVSFRIKVKDGFIHGMKNFSIQKPRARQFPYDQIFHEINSNLGRLSSSQQDFASIKVNDESWGVMLVEPSIDNIFIEVRDLKRSGLFKISDQDIWVYNKKDGVYKDYYLSDPTITLSQTGIKNKFENEASKEIYSHIFKSINTKNGNIFDRKLMIGNLALALVWGDLHTLFNSNARYTWNTYEQKLEPILSDQAASKNISLLMDSFDNFLKLPYEFKIIFQENPLKLEELMNEIFILEEYFKTFNVIEKSNQLKEKYFISDNKFTRTDVQNNIDYLKDNIENVVFKINKSSSFQENFSAKTLNKQQIDLIDNFVKVIHYENGIVRVYNYLNQPVHLIEVLSSSKKVEVNKTIPGSQTNSLSFIDIKTDFFGDFSSMIEVTTELGGMHKKSKNDFTIVDFDYSKLKPKSANIAKLCNENSKKYDLCQISGNHDINESIVFDTNVRISPGTKLFLGLAVDLIFESSVSMNGLLNSPIEIYGNNTGGIFIKNESEAISTIKNVKISKLATTVSPLRKYTGAINGYGGRFNIKNLTIDGSDSEDQLNLINTEVNIDGLYISNARSDAFDCDFCTGNLTNINFKNIGGDGLDVSGSTLKVTSMKAFSIKDKALSVGERSTLILSDATFNDAGTGVAVKDASDVMLDGIVMSNIQYDAFMTYVKKPFFIGKTNLEVNQFEVDVSKNSICIREKNTYLVLNGKLCEISEISIDELYSGRMKK